MSQKRNSLHLTLKNSSRFQNVNRLKINGRDQHAWARVTKNGSNKNLFDLLFYFVLNGEFLILLMLTNSIYAKN